MEVDKLSAKRAQVVFVGSRGSGKSSLYQCLKSANPHVIDVPSSGVLCEEWRPFDVDVNPVAEECQTCVEENFSEEDRETSIQVWDICGRESLWTCQQLCISSKALFVLVFNVRNALDARKVPQWVQMVQAKSLGAHMILAASNCEVCDGDCQQVLAEVKDMDNSVVGAIQEELKSLRELQPNVWIENRIEKLETLVQNRPNICPTVFQTSAVTGKGVSDLRRAILKHVFDVEKFPHVHQALSGKEIELRARLGACHDGKNMVMSLRDYKDVASSAGLTSDEELENATENLAVKGFLARVNIAETIDQPGTSVILTDPCCFASACAMIHRSEENPQDFVNKLQRSSQVQRFWPTSTRPNDWTLRSAIEDVVDRGMVRESFLPLCWQKWDVSEDDIKKLLPVMLKLGVLSDGAPKAGYEIELALSYFKNLSVTKRYHLPLLRKLPKSSPQQDAWPDKSTNSCVSIGWQYRFQDGCSPGLWLCVLAACKNYKRGRTVLAHWQTGIILRTGDVNVRIVSQEQVLHLTARCRITRGSKQALNMAWLTLAHFLYVTESYLTNFPGLYYQIYSKFNGQQSPRPIYYSLQDCTENSEDIGSSRSLWVLPRCDHNSSEQAQSAIPSDILTWLQRLSGQSSICIAYHDNQCEEVKLLASNLEQCGFVVALQRQFEDVSFRKSRIRRCSFVILLLTKAYVEDPSFHEDVASSKSNSKPIIAARFARDLTCDLSDVVWVDLHCGTGRGLLHTFDHAQLSCLITECQVLVYGSGDIEPLTESQSAPVNATSVSPSRAPALESDMEPSQRSSGARQENPAKKADRKKQVQFSPLTEDLQPYPKESEIKPLAACTVAAAMVGAAAEHLNLSRKASSAGMRAANATAKVARSVANGNADAATEALNEVVRIVDGVSTPSKQKENGYGPPPKSKTCVIF